MWPRADLKRDRARSDRVFAVRGRLETHKCQQERRRSSTLKRRRSHKMTAPERAAIARHFARCESTPSIRCKVSRNGSDLQIGFDHPDRLVDRALVMDALASADEDFLNGIMYQLGNASAHGQDIDERAGGEFAACHRPASASKRAPMWRAARTG